MKTKRVLYFALLALVSAQFGIVGMLKLIGFAPLYQQLATLHIAPSLGWVIGACEVAGVMGLWIRRTRTLALLGLLVLAVSAVAVHFGAAVPLTRVGPALVAVALLTSLLVLGNPRAMAALLRSEEAV